MSSTEQNFLSKFFIKESCSVYEYCLQSLVLQRGNFPDIIGQVFPNNRTSGYISPKNLNQLYTLISENYFFYFWYTQKELPLSIWDQEDDEPIKTETEEFNDPVWELEHFLFDLFPQSNKEKLPSIVQTLLSKHSHTHWVNEYYGESSTFKFIKIKKEDLSNLLTSC